jgi:lipopolysaccharide/colanic/teichoic acid biosynthesis glycosyltransferase
VSRPILGSLDDIEAIFHDRVVDEVAVCLPPTAARWLEPVTRLAADEGKTVRIPLDPVEAVLTRAYQEEFEGFLVRSLVHDEQHEVALVAKRVMDIAGAAIGLVVLSPLILGTAVILRLREGSPILFRQTRVGRHGRPFTICKFRTMVPDAEGRLAEVQHLNERDAIAFKASDDPRITGFGRTLRATSLDELPQLWNVLKAR